MGIKDNIKKLRESHGMTQADFGKIVGVSDKAVSTWENGTAVPRIGSIEKLSKYFQISKSEIIGDEEEMKDARAFESLKYYADFINLYSKLDVIDQARIEERIKVMLEADKYKEG